MLMKMNYDCLLRAGPHLKHLLKRRFCANHMRSELRMWNKICHPIMASYSTEPLVQPKSSNETKQYPAKLQNIVSEISKLTLLEVAELNELLKKSLNIPDTPMMAMGAMPAMASSQTEGEEQEAPKTQTSFTVRLSKYEEAKKVAVIKEIKSIIEGMNLVQAKKFVEGAPQVVKADVGKDEAEKIKKALEAVGATCEIE